MGDTEENIHVTSDGTQLYTKTWKAPQEPPLALLFFLHGFSDHSNIHHELFPILASRGIQVVSFDQRGYGKSVKDKASRGVSGTTATVLADITSIMEPYLSRTEAPIFLMGHSMGGAEAIYYAARGPSHVRQRIRGYISEAPWIGLHEAAQPNRLIVVSGRLISKILPHQQRLVDLDPKLVSRDPAVGEAFLADELCHSTGTLEGLAGCLHRADQLRNGEVMPMDDLSGKQPPISLLLAHGTADGITSFKVSKTFMEKVKVKDKDFRVYEGWYHKLHAEPGGDGVRFDNDVADWILERLESPKVAKPQDLERQSSKL